MKRLAIIGSGDLGQQIAHHAVTDGHYKVAGFFDDFQELHSVRHGYPVLGAVDDIEKVFNAAEFDCLMIAIGYKHMRQRAALYDRFKMKIPFGTIIHSSAYVDKSCSVAAGVVICPRTILDMNVVIEENVLLNTACVITHDSCIGSHSFLSPAVNVAGFVKVESSVSLGIGTILIDNLTICKGTRTGAGAVVIKNIDEPGLYVGVPAVLKKSYDTL